MTTFLSSVQVLLLDLENPETPPIVLDQNLFPLPQGQQSVVNTGATDFPMLIPQEDPANSPSEPGQKFDRYLVYLKRGHLFIVDLLKNGQFPMPRRLSSAAVLSGPFYMARYDWDQPGKSYLAFQAVVDGQAAWRYARLDMNATDEALNALPFDPSKAQIQQDGSSYFPMLALEGSVQGGFRLSQLQVNPDGTTYRKVLQHLDESGNLLREFSSATIGFPFPDPPHTPPTFDMHPYLVWSSAELSVLAIAPGPTGIPAPGGYALYRPSTQELVTGVLPALPVAGGTGGFDVLAEVDHALFFTEMAADGVLSLHAIDKRTTIRSSVRPDLKSPRALFTRWPYLVVMENDGQVSSLDLATPGYPSLRLPNTTSQWPYELMGLGLDTAVSSDFSSVQIQSLGSNNNTRFENTLFLGWSSVYSPEAIKQPLLSGKPFSEDYGYPGLGWSRPDGELGSFGPARSVLPLHFLMVDESGVERRVTGISVSTRQTIEVGVLPNDLTVMAGYQMTPQPTYAGRWVIFHAVGQKARCETVPGWIVGTFCMEQYSDIFVADPASAASLRRLTDQSTSRF